MPRVTVITATYNWSSVLRCAIESVLRQSFTDWEMLVVGDGCTDDSGAVVDSFRDDRVRWHNLDPRHGHQSGPNNLGLQKARGEYIAYLGHDDLWHRDHLAHLVAAMDAGADVAWSWMELIGPAPLHYRALAGVLPEDGDSSKLILFPSSLMHCHALAAELGGWKDFRTLSVAPEVDLVGRFREAGKSFVSARRLTAFKFSASMRAGCYLEKPSHEQREMLRRMDEEPDFIERELLAIAGSYEQRQPSSQTRHKESRADLVGRGVVEAQRRRGVPGIGRPAAALNPPPVGGRVEMDQDDALDHLWFGWSDPEEGFRWSEGPDAGLQFSATPGEPLTFVMSCAPFLGKGKIVRQEIRVLLNGTLTATLSLDAEPRTVHEIGLPGTLVREQNELIFEFPGAVSPLAIGLNEDARVLALEVQWFELRR